MAYITYYKQIGANPHFTMRNFAPLIRKGMEDGNTYHFKEPIELGGTLYSISFEAQRMRLSIRWTDEESGEEREQIVTILKERSNLPSLSGSYVYYFVCPRTGNKARVLYRIGSHFWSRRAFKAVYPLQMESKHNRAISYREDPYRKNGKEYYRGKLTPYGKRCIRYEQHERQQLQAIQNFLSRFGG